MKSEFPYRPPLVDIPPGVSAALDMAFGPVDEKLVCEGDISDSSAVVEAAQRMVLSGRIASRWPRRILEELLVPEGTEAFRQDLRRTALAELRAEAIVETVAATAHSLNMPVVFLKGAALIIEGLILPGSRGLVDVDVLAPEGREHELQDRLKADGCVEPKDLPSGEHQLQVLAHPLGLAVEVHLCLRGVRGPTNDSMTYSDLRESSSIRLLSGLPGESYAPNRDVLLAHALVHGLAQHGLNPKSYPMLRFVADMVDLDLVGSLERGDFERWRPWVERDVSQVEIEALSDMCRRLQNGDSANAIWIRNDGAALMLRHLVLGAVDGEYRDSLRLRSLTSVLPSRGRGATLLRTVWGATILTRGQIEAAYGKPRSSWGYWGYRLYRPFDLAKRTLRYGVAAIKARRR